jgi:glycosyltransferase involved in cell wall biosynthesis
MKVIPSQIDPPAPMPAGTNSTVVRTGTEIPTSSNGQLMPVIIKKLSIIIPAYNEARTIHLILDKVKDVFLIRNIEKEVIVVNDCSKDDTEQVIQAYMSNNPAFAIRYLKHTVNQGKGAAIHTGIAHATGEYLVVQDADLEYDPDEYNTLLKPIVNGFADVVYGSRFMGGNAHRILFFWHTIGNRLLTFLSNMFCNLNLTDMETCYKVFRTALIQQIKLEEKRFGFEPEVTVKIAQIPDLRIYEVGISYYGRTYKEGKKIGWKDGVRTVFCILKYSLFNNHVLLQPEEKKIKTYTEQL